MLGVGGCESCDVLFCVAAADGVASEVPPLASSCAEIATAGIRKTLIIIGLIYLIILKPVAKR